MGRTSWGIKCASRWGPLKKVSTGLVFFVTLSGKTSLALVTGILSYKVKGKLCWCYNVMKKIVDLRSKNVE